MLAANQRFCRFVADSELLKGRSAAACKCIWLDKSLQGETTEGSAEESLWR